MRAFGRVAVRVLKFAMYGTWVLAALAVLLWEALGFYIDRMSDRSLDDASAVNARGDGVIAETERESGGKFRATTAIKLKRAHHWFATELLKVESDDYLVGFKWRGDDRLELTLDFGCSAQMTEPVASVGPIHIVYRFDRSGIFPAHGYSSFPGEVRKPCE